MEEEDIMGVEERDKDNIAYDLITMVSGKSDLSL